MPRLIEMPDARAHPPACTIAVGDLLLFRTTGGHVRSGHAVIEMVGVFVQATAAEDGTVVTPMGPPNVVLFRGLKPGRARIDVVSGYPLHAPRKTILSIVVASGTGVTEGEIKPAGRRRRGARRPAPPARSRST